MNALMQDIRYGARMLAKSPGFTLIAVLTLALGIGANTAIFSVVNSTLLAPLPFRDASQLVNLHAHSNFFDFWNLGLSLPDINDIRSRSKSFSAVVPFEYSSVDFAGRDNPQQLNSAKIPGDFFSLLGIKPLLGRTFLASGMQAGADREVILSGKLWRTQFGADPRVVGTSITLDEKPYTVVGVMPEIPELAFSPATSDLWTPFVPTQSQLKERGNHGIPAMARLRPGMTVKQARAELDGIAAELAKAYPKDDKDWSFRVASLRTDMNRETQTPLLILLGAVGFVLLIACANVGNLFLSRGVTRRRELAIRSTLGATRGRLIRQLMVESTLLALLGGACALVVAYWSVEALRTLAAKVFFGAENVAIDPRVLYFTLGVAILAGLLFGLAPAFLSSRYDLSRAMKEGGGGSQAGASGPRHNPFRHALVVAEISLALVLVIGATLALRSFSNLLSAKMGFQTENVVVMSLEFSATKFKNQDEMFAYVRALTERIRQTPGVEAASAGGNSPLSGSRGEGEFTVEGTAENPDAKPTADWSSVGPGYFATLGIPLLRGRDFAALDSGTGSPVMIVNRAFADKFLGGKDPVGKRIWMGDEDAKHNRIWNEIVGEVGDSREINPAKAPLPEMYAAFFQSNYTSGMFNNVELLVRTRESAGSLIPAIQNQLWAFDKGQPISRIQTMQQRIAISVASPKFQGSLLGAFGALGLVLALVGIYGVISYSVTQRTHEIGIRMALGADPEQVLRLVLRQGLMLALAGVGIGLIAALALTRFMRTLLFGITATDPLTFAGVSILLVLVAIAACYIPARRAMQVDPMIALRYE